MYSSRRQNHEELGAYTTVAQTEAAGADPTTTEDVLFEAPVHIGSIPTAEDMLFLPRVADTLPHGAFLVAIVELCERLGLVVDPIGTDDWATLAVSSDLVAFQRPGERAFLKCFTPQAEARARALLSG